MSVVLMWRKIGALEAQIASYYVQISSSVPVYILIKMCCRCECEKVEELYHGQGTAKFENDAVYKVQIIWFENTYKQLFLVTPLPISTIL